MKICPYAAILSLALHYPPVPARAQTLAPPDRTKVLALADVYVAESQKRLSPDDRLVFEKMQKQLIAVQQSPRQVKITIESLVNQLTGALASMASPDGITASSALLVKLEPDNPRVSNLFGAVLHSTARFRDAVKVLEFTLSQSPSSTLARLNLANVYLDAGKDAAAKQLADQVLRKEPDSREAYKVIAAYWYKKKNLKEFQAALLKASSFEGYQQRASETAKADIDANEITPGMPVAEMERRAKKLDASVPLTTADLIETADPGVARQIRKQYALLPAEERMALPAFPQIKSNSNQDYVENYPVVIAWMQTFVSRQGEHQLARFGISANDNEQVATAKARAIGKEQMTQGLQQAQDAMKFLSGMGAVSKAQVDAAMRQVRATASAQGLTLKNRAATPASPPGFDSGAVFSRANYVSYLSVSRSYEAYIRELFHKQDLLVSANLEVYAAKLSAEQVVHDRIMEGLDPKRGASTYEIAVLREHIRHTKAANHIGDTYYKLWANIYLPDYAQRMKPALERYWAVLALYLKNMSDPGVTLREYERVKGFYMQYAVQAGTGAAQGAAFGYVGSTEDEEAALAQAIAASTEDAKVQIVTFDKDHKVHKIKTFAERPTPDEVLFWLDKKPEFAIHGQFLELTVTARSIEFNAWAMGPAAGIKLEFGDDGKVKSLTSYVAVEARFKFGIQVAGVDLTAGGTADFGRQTASWDFEKGSYVEGYPPPNASVNLAAKAGNFEATNAIKYDLAKGMTASTLGVSAGFGPMTTAGEISYDAASGISGKASATTAAGPMASALTTEFDSQLRFKRSGEVTAFGKSAYAKDFSSGPP